MVLDSKAEEVAPFQIGEEAPAVEIDKYNNIVCTDGVAWGQPNQCYKAISLHSSDDLQSFREALYRLVFPTLDMLSEEIREK